MKFIVVKMVEHIVKSNVQVILLSQVVDWKLEVHTNSKIRAFRLVNGEKVYAPEVETAPITIE